MKILFDHQVFSSANYGGVALYFYELMKGLSKNGHQLENTVKFSENVFTTDRLIFNSVPLLPRLKFRGRVRLKNSINQVYTNAALKRNDFDIFHPTNYDTYYLSKLSPKKPLVTTFYDLNHERLANGNAEISGTDQMISNRKKILSASSKVIAISHSTKNDIVDYYKVDPSRIEVIHLSSSLKMDQLHKDESLGDYILFVGNRQGYKNFTKFVSAITPALKKNKSLKLVCAGGGDFSKKEHDSLNELKIQSQVINMPINDLLLSQLYYNALFFVFPSLYEGFGIPILESLSCNCPALLSDRSSLPEIGGSAAMYFNPEDEEDILDKVELLLSNQSLRDEMKQMGKKQSERFSWDKMTQETISLYKSQL